MLAAGLNPRGHSFSNDAYSEETHSALSFHGNGVAHTNPFRIDGSGETATILLALSPAADPESRGFQSIAVLANGSPENQLMVAQWKRQLMVMTGDDYAHRNKAPRLTTPTQGNDTGSVLLTVTINNGEAALHTNGASSSTQPSGFGLPNNQPLKLILGNSADGKLPWSGQILGFALYNKVLTASEIDQYESIWTTTQHFSEFSTDNAELLYDFSEFRGDIVDDRSSHTRHLLIPKYRTFVDPDFPRLTINSTSWSDFLLNLLGFVPFGYLLMTWLLRGHTTVPVVRPALLVLAGGLLFSSAIEISQAWIPSRSASLLDVLLNSAGALLGACARIARNRAYQHTSRDA